MFRLVSIYTNLVGLFSGFRVITRTFFHVIALDGHVDIGNSLDSVINLLENSVQFYSVINVLTGSTVIINHNVN